jgi:hypothetical protein
MQVISLSSSSLDTAIRQIESSYNVFMSGNYDEVLDNFTDVEICEALLPKADHPFYRQLRFKLSSLLKEDRESIAD